MERNFRIALWAFLALGLGQSFFDRPSTQKMEEPAESPAGATGRRSVRKSHRHAVYATGGAPTQAESTGLEIQSEFHELAEQVLRNLPTLRSLDSLTNEEVHGTPKPLMAAGAELGRIAQAVEDHPELAPEALGFYVRCSEKQDLPNTVRALCYSHVLEAPEHPQTAELPAEVLRIASLLVEPA